MAGLGRKVFAAGEVLTAANVQNYLQDQAVMVFDDATDRATVLGTAVSEGMTTYLKDVNTVQVYDGSTWKVVTSDPTFTASTATSYTIQNGDANGYIRFTSAATVTINSATGFDPGQQVQLFADGPSLRITSSGVNIAGAGTAGTGITLLAGDRYVAIGIICVATNDYRVIGNVLGV